MSTTEAALPTLDDIREARTRIDGEVRHTPVIQTDQLTRLHGSPIILKYEHLQRTGSFKIRGALNLVAQLSDAERAAGVVAASAGNHAQGVAVAARANGIEATIFMPRDAPLSKLKATRAYGANVDQSGTTFADALERAQQFASASGATFIHPYDDPRIIAGQGTVGMEIVEAVPEAATVVTPVGGGGLASGICIAIKEQRPDVRIIGVQAETIAGMVASRSAGVPTAVDEQATMADGIAVKRPGDLTYAVLDRYLDDLVTVSEDHIARAIVWLLERAKQVVEGAGAAPLAALMSGAISASGPTVLVMSGGNIDSMLLLSVVRHGLSVAGRFVRIATRLSDRPGQLATMLTLLGEHRVNIIGVEHQREGSALAVGEAHVEVIVETRDREHVEEILALLNERGFAAHIETD